ncbi:1-(5-phosphoribosyl)-5-[(5-phosphoribosylamino)methylideneamino] imidazole-4-carboxamide isomerase [Caulifigura coniformis]|uniref:1-(5-phosphoribosyl)-5-[(5-phosphoribosylamino)methylideneamino] imidazole-4-carboxamide isomerase n=1 Tax=Caulifigura coniformis TaxID=2527983 RepID=A0A517SH29_9PLAN|nr:HisA/HisF-related TIM barrel protein [Caulifigura coniformis]QDT55407.1 1-(5-phosphoribosyl)-5-[(5-phosphoribosylamino)methylideneamino] imidazole-4-carboxamide isomerase [Caulifigura coniformis]
MNEALRSRLLPVLDVKGGQVVRGVAGRRDEYRPIVSRLTDSVEPGGVLLALAHAFGFTRFYIADLDAICDRRSRLGDLTHVQAYGVELDVDLGIQSPEDLERLVAIPGLRPIIGLESIGSRDQFSAVLSDVDCERLVFSLDLMNGRPIATPDWPTSAIEVASIAVEAGIRSLTVLDLAAVGTGQGCPTLPLCRAIRSRWPELEVITGGGVRGEQDVLDAVAAGADRVLVASALHDGRIR